MNLNYSDPSMQILESAIDSALDHDAENTLKEAVLLRQKENIKPTPQIVLVRAAHHPSIRGTGLLRKYAAQIINNAEEPVFALEYHNYRYPRQPIPNALKKVWRDALIKFSRTELSNCSGKLVDLINLVHPKSKAIDGFMRNGNKTRKIDI